MSITYAAIAKNLSTFDCDCTVTVALKISDDSCKMDSDGRKLFMSLYHALPSYTSSLYDYSVHLLIINAFYNPSDSVLQTIKAERERAMAIISQEKMKEFKSSVRTSLIIAQHTAAII